MGHRRRRLIQLDVRLLSDEAFLALLEERLAAIPEAAQYPDETVEDFLTAAIYLDHMDRKEIVEALKRARIPFPPELALSEYRLCRHLLRKWLDPALRGALLRSLDKRLDYGLMARLKRQNGGPELEAFCRKYNPVVAFSVFRMAGVSQLISTARAILPPKTVAAHQAFLMWGRLELHRFTTGPEPALPSSRWEQQKLLRRIHLRNVQLRSMSRNLHSLRQEQKSLLTGLRKFDHGNVPELDALARELEEIRTARAEAERQHAAALAAQAQRWENELAQLRALAAASVQDYKETLAGQPAWATVARRR